MAFKFSTGFRNSILVTGSVKNALDAGFIKIYSGTPPATADAALSGNTELVNISIDGLGVDGLTFDAAAADGVIQKTASEVWKGTNANSGTATFFRFVKSGDTGASSSTAVRVQGNVGVAGSDMNLASTVLAATEEQVIDYFAIAFPSA